MRYFVRTTGDRNLDISFNQIKYTLLIDRDHNAGNAFRTWLPLFVEDDCVILEDDIILCNNFQSRIEEEISKTPNQIINFFRSNTFFQNYYIINKPSELKSSGFSFTQCVYFPCSVFKKLKNCIEKDNIRSYSVRKTIRQSMFKTNTSFRLAVPFPVQHIDTESLMGHDFKEFKRRSPLFYNYLDELGITYEDVLKNSTLIVALKNCMDKHMEKYDK